MQAIVTKFICPSNTRAGQYKATCQGGSVTIGVDYGLSPQANHAAAAEALVRKMGWVPANGRGFVGEWLVGWLPNGNVCFVFRAYIYHTPGFRIDE